MSSSDRALINAVRTISGMCDRINLPKTISDRANMYVFDCRLLSLLTLFQMFMNFIFISSLDFSRWFMMEEA